MFSPGFNRSERVQVQAALERLRSATCQLLVANAKFDELSAATTKADNSRRAAENIEAAARRELLQLCRDHAMGQR